MSVPYSAYLPYLSPIEVTIYYFVTIGQTSGCLIVIDLNSNGEESVSILPCLVRLDG